MYALQNSFIDVPSLEVPSGRTCPGQMQELFLAGFLRVPLDEGGISRSLQQER